MSQERRIFPSRPGRALYAKVAGPCNLAVPPAASPLLMVGDCDQLQLPMKGGLKLVPVRRPGPPLLHFCCHHHRGPCHIIIIIIISNM